jgi:hypothetical protein
METFKIQSRVGKDGILRLEIPVDAADTDLEVVVVVQPTTVQDFDRAEWLAFIDETAGSLTDDPIERLPQGDYEKREPIE